MVGRLGQWGRQICLSLRSSAESWCQAHGPFSETHPASLDHGPIVCWPWGGGTTWGPGFQPRPSLLLSDCAWASVSPSVKWGGGSVGGEVIHLGVHKSRGDETGLVGIWAGPASAPAARRVLSRAWGS